MLETESLQPENNAKHEELNQSRAQAAVWQQKVEVGTIHLKVVVKTWLDHSTLVLDIASTY